MLIKIFRWILFLPLGLLAGSLIGVGIYFMGAAMTSPGSIGSYIFAIWGGGLSGGVFCYAACYVAPKFKQKVALVLTVITFALYAITTYFLWDDSLEQHLLAVSQALGFGYVGIQIFRNKITAGKPL